MRPVSSALTALALALVAGCTVPTPPPAPTPLAATQVFDTEMNCIQLVSEYEANQMRMGSLTHEAKEGLARNGGITSTALLPGGVPLPVTIQSAGTGRPAVGAVGARNQRLAELARARDCPEAEAMAAGGSLAAAAAAPETSGD